MHAEVVKRMRADLTRAMKERDTTAVRALRTALAAVSNAEAPPASVAPTPVHGRPNEHPRVVLSSDDVACILRSEIQDLHDTIARILPHGRVDEADELRAEAEVLETYLA